MSDDERKPVLGLKDLRVVRGGAVELDALSCTIDRGETLIVLGDDRSGKDALLRVLAGFAERADDISGTIRLGAGDEQAVTRKLRSPIRTVYLPGPAQAPLSPNSTVASQLARVVARRHDNPRASGREELRIALERMPGAPSFDDRAAELSLTGVAVTDADVLGGVGEGLPAIERVVEAGIAAMGAEAVGAMEVLHEMTLDYSRTRQQFGKPIGQNQVVQHRLADMLMSLEQGRSMTMLATVSVEEPDAAGRARNMSMAKVGYGQAARFVSQQAIQLHGGIGMTEELAVGHFFRRCMVIEHSFGDTAYHLAKLAEETPGGLA